MPIKTELWRIDHGLKKVPSSSLEAESRLEAAIDADIGVIDPNLMIIGRQVQTPFGKYIDLLAINPSGDLVVLELKRNKTPREVVAQILDYATWVQELKYDAIASIYNAYAPHSEFETAYAQHFGGPPPEEINQQHRLLIVAAEMDNATERIVNYLSTAFGVPINVVFFQYYRVDGGEFLARSWLIDPAQAEVQAEKGARLRGKELWNGSDFYCSFGEGPRRSWKDAITYGFISAGGGKWYSHTLAMLTSGARVFVFIPQTGYVGVGKVLEEVKPVSEFTVEINGTPTPILNAPLVANAMGENANDPELCEYLVRIQWESTRPLEEAIWEKGMFANQNSACKLRNKFTLERLYEHFSLNT